MTARGIMLALLLWAPALVAQGEQGERAGSGSTLIVAEHLWTGDQLLSPGRVLVRDGKILKVGQAEIRAPGACEVVHVAWVLPGLVLADSSSLAGSETQLRTITPALRVLDGFDPFIPRPELQATGITAIYLSPGHARLLAGQGAVIRVGTEAALDHVIKAPAAMQGSVEEQALRPGTIFEPPVAPAEDTQPLRPARRQFPHARGGAFMALRKLFERAAGPAGSHVPDDRYASDLRALRPMLSGKIPLRVRAETAADIYGAIQLARRFKLKLVVEGATEAWRLPHDLARAGACVVLRAGEDPRGKLPPPEPFHSPRGRANPRSAAILHEAGVKLALVPARADAFDDLLWYAAQARAGSFGSSDVLRAVTADAAVVLGISDQAGSLRPGAAADLVGFDQDPLDAAARPVFVLVSGKRTFSRAKDKQRPIAIFGRTVHTGRGAPLHDAVVLVEDGKITAVGSNVTIPPGARRVHIKNAVVVPGFIDAGGQVGVRAYRQDDSGDLQEPAALGTLPLSQSPWSLFDARFPDVLAVARSGVTTVVLTPGGGQAVSGSCSLVKTSGDPETSLLREGAGVLFDYSKTAYSASAVSGLRRTLSGAKRYVEGWKKYEKALAAWKKKHPEGASERSSKKLEQVTAPLARDPISGTWDGTIEADGLTLRLGAELRLKGQAVSGTVQCTLLPDGQIPVDATFQEGVLSFDLEVRGIQAHVEMEVGRDEMVGSWDAAENGGGQIILKRVALPARPVKKKAQPKDSKDSSKQKPDGKGGAGKKAADKKGSKGKTSSKTSSKTGPPKAPKKVAALEPYKALFALETPAFLALGTSERLGRAMLKVFREEFELKTVLLAPQLAPQVLDLMENLGVALACTGPGVFRKDGRWQNPALLAVQHRLPVILRSGSKGDARTLYASASYVVRQGMDPADALRMITRWPAQVLGVDDHVGTIKRGLDADLVILDGDVFVPGTRVVKVMVNGRMVAEEDQR